MNRLLLAGCVAAIAVCVPSFQRRAKPKAPKDFKTEWTAAMEAFTHKQLGKCLQHIDRAKGLVTGLWTKLVSDSLPPAPSDEWKSHDKKRDDAAAANILGMGNLVARNIERTYTGPGGKSFKLTLQLDAPMVAAMGNMFDNPLFRPKGAELIEYDGYKGLLEGANNRHTMKMILMKKHYLEGKSNKMTADEVLAILSQKNVDRIIAALEGNGTPGDK